MAMAIGPQAATGMTLLYPACGPRLLGQCPLRRSSQPIRSPNTQRKRTRARTERKLCHGQEKYTFRGMLASGQIYPACRSHRHNPQRHRGFLSFFFSFLMAKHSYAHERGKLNDSTTPCCSRASELEFSPESSS